MKIAIIGSGISGLYAAHLLHKDHYVSVYEANNYIGGHTSTHDFVINDKHVHADTGFIVFNPKNYPLFSKLLIDLGVEIIPTSMSVSVFNPTTGLEYNGAGLNMIYSQRKNIFSKKYNRMIREIFSFNAHAKAYQRSEKVDLSYRLKDFIRDNNYSRWFEKYYIAPMGTAVWSASANSILNTPFYFFSNFFSNHGMLNILDRPNWFVIKGGSKSYIPNLTKGFSNNIHTNMPVTNVRRNTDGVTVKFENGEEKIFDKVIFATHSDQALKLLDNPSSNEQEVLSGISFEKNDIVVHTDTTLLPKNKKIWGSWNIQINENSDHPGTLTYDMNNLYSQTCKEQILVSLNKTDQINESKILKRISHSHPTFDMKSIASQNRHDEINGNNNTYYCGAYWGNGFHEDGIKSALKVRDKLLSEQKIAAKTPHKIATEA